MGRLLSWTLTYRQSHLEGLGVENMVRLIFCGLVVQRGEKLLCELKVAHVGGVGSSLCFQAAQGLQEGEVRQDFYTDFWHAWVSALGSAGLTIKQKCLGLLTIKVLAGWLGVEGRNGDGFHPKLEAGTDISRRGARGWRCT